MFVYGADFFLVKPGFVLLVLGLLITIPLSFGQVSIGPVTLSLYWSIAGVALAVLGLQSVYLGVIVRMVNEDDGAIRRRWLRRFRYNRAVTLSVFLFAVGIALVSSLIFEYIGHDLSLSSQVGTLSYRTVTGLLLMIIGFMTFTFTLVLHAFDLAARRLSAEGSRPAPQEPRPK